MPGNTSRILEIKTVHSFLTSFCFFTLWFHFYSCSCKEIFYMKLYDHIEPSAPRMIILFSASRWGTAFVLIILSRHITKPMPLCSHSQCIKSFCLWASLSNYGLSYCFNYNPLTITKRVLCVWRSVPPLLRFFFSFSLSFGNFLSSLCFSLSFWCLYYS